jgi:tRNA pseudouridine65 synthase
VPGSSPSIDRSAVLHADRWLIAVNKPSGLAVHPGWSPRSEATALAWVRRLAGVHVHPVHRLDRATSGVLLFALDSTTAGLVGKAFEHGRVVKRYVALVRGTPAEHGVVDHPIPRREGGDRVEAVTEFRRIAISDRDRCSLVEAVPRTGRLHQIRRHLKHLSHPIVGDVRYGKGDINRHYRAAWGLHRLALHAAVLELEHPHTGAWLGLRAPVPDDLRGPWAALGLQDGCGSLGPLESSRSPEARRPED